MSNRFMIVAVALLACVIAFTPASADGVPKAWQSCPKADDCVAVP